MIERETKQESKKKREEDIETEREAEIGRDNEGEKIFGMRVEFLMTNVSK